MAEKDGTKSGGRVKGTFNKNKQILLDKIKVKYPDYCPIEAMCEIATDLSNDLTTRLTASKEVCQYVYPKLKAVDHNHGIEGTLTINMISNIPAAPNTQPKLVNPKEDDTQV